jgi:hypothetical protein
LGNKKIDDYISKIGKVINTPIGSLSDSDTNGYAQSAAKLANNKVTELATKKTYFSNFERTTQKVIDTAKQVDGQVSTNISTIAESYIEKRKWYEAAGDWIYNTFCVDLANHFSLVRDFVDGAKWVFDKVGNVLDKIHDWFKYGDGQYILKIAISVVGAVVAVAGTIAAVCAIPFSGGLSIPLVIGCIGALATSVGAIITVGNSLATVKTSSKALSLSGNPFDDDGDLGAARYYGSASKMSDLFEKYDWGDEETNAGFETAGKVIDTTKVVADTTAFVCNIASLGNVKDYRITTRTDNVNFTYNNDQLSKGYSFTYENIKRNILHDMGRTVTTGKFKDGSFGLKLVASDKTGKYTLHFANTTFSCPEKLVKFFNVVKTTDNTMNFMKNTDGLYDFYTDSDKTLSDLSSVVKNITGFGKISKEFSIFDRYGTKTGKALTDIIGGGI